MARKQMRDSEDIPAWARYNGETYISGFSGTAKQKRESEKAWKELLAKRKKGKGSSSKKRGSRGH